MINYAAGFFGWVILIALSIDVLQSTIGYGTGPLVDRLTGFIANGLEILACKYSWRRLLAATGFISIGLNYVLWLAGLWLGWSLVFCGSATAVLDSSSDTPADLWTRFYFAGYCISTLGIGDYRPGNVFWQMLTVLASLSGLVLVTFLLSVLIGLLQATQTRRQTALYIRHLGTTPANIVQRHWNGSGCGPLQEHLIILTLKLAELEQQHRYFPALHRFHNFDPHEDIGVALVALSEAMLMLNYGISGPPLVCPITLDTAQRALHGFLGTSRSNTSMMHGDPLPMPSLQSLRELGVEIVSDDEFASRVSRWHKYRVQMLYILRSSGWDWEIINAGV